MKAILRRKNDPHDNGSAPRRFDRLEIDERAREARVDGERVRLTPREFELLLELARNPGVAFSRDRILQKIWGYDYAGDPRTVDVHVHRLREKLKTAAGLRSSSLRCTGSVISAYAFERLPKRIAV